MARNGQGKSKNNNPEGRNQYSSGWADGMRDRPFTAAAAIGGAVAAGVFLWSRRNQITDQIVKLGDQINTWRDDFLSERTLDQSTTESEPFMAKPAKRSSRKSQKEIAEEALTLKETGEPTATGL